MNHIELFAGCGGLTLGLESEGFELFFANELSPMAAETFAYNILGHDLDDMARKGGLGGDVPVYWLRSGYDRSELRYRLRENPQIADKLKNPFNDIHLVDTSGTLEGALLVGSILELNDLLKDRGFKSQVKAGTDGKGVDLVSGGPPCQSFSMAGLRQMSNKRNSLPWEFAEFVRAVEPKMALLENVPGILHAFSRHGEKFHAWFEVAKAFAYEGYVPLCLHVNAKYVGAAQNRPRYIMLAFQVEVAKKIRDRSGCIELENALRQSMRFKEKLERAGEDVDIKDLSVHKVENGSTLFQSEYFHPLVERKGVRWIKPVSAYQALEDLPDEGEVFSFRTTSKYVNYINREAFNPQGVLRRKPRINRNHVFRDSRPEIRDRFWLYQVLRDLREVSLSSEYAIRHYLKTGSNNGGLNQAIDDMAEMLGQGSPINDYIDDYSPRNLRQLLDRLKTKKHTQKALVARQPAPAALSIPDDACHYRAGSYRTLTVREMARLQSFPDWFEFRSKVTTGSHMRRYEVPQYTQVGNAVPPLLGKALGKVCRSLLELAED